MILLYCAAVWAAQLPVQADSWPGTQYRYPFATEYGNIGQDLLCEGVERGWASEFSKYAKGVRADAIVGWGHPRDVKAYVVKGTDDGVELSLQRHGVGKIEKSCAAEVLVLRAVPGQTDGVVPDTGTANLPGQTGAVQLLQALFTRRQVTARDWFRRCSGGNVRESPWSYRDQQVVYLDGSLVAPI